MSYAMYRIASSGKPRPVTLIDSRVVAIGIRRNIEDQLEHLEEQYFFWNDNWADLCVTDEDFIEVNRMLSLFERKIVELNRKL